MTIEHLKEKKTKFEEQGEYFESVGFSKLSEEFKEMSKIIECYIEEKKREVTT